MLKNTAGQRVGAQLVSATDGSAFTGAVTVYVTGDAGTQAVGSVGAGACVHEGNGYHTYAPAQAETNYDLAAFTFVGSGAVPVTVQVYTRAGDAFTRLGAPAGASIAADIAAVQSDTNDIQARLPAALVGGRMDVALSAAGLATDAVAEIVDAVWASSVRTLSALDEDSTTIDLDATVRSAIGMAAGNLDTQLAALQADTNDIQTRLPAALVSGRMDANVGAMAANVITAAATAADFLTELQNTVQSGLDAYDVPTTAELDARTLASADYASAASLDEVANQIGIGGDGLTAVLDAVGAVAPAVWEEATADHETAGSMGAAVAAAGSAGDPWSTVLPGSYGAGTAGNIIGNRLDIAVSAADDAVLTRLGVPAGASIAADIAAIDGGSGPTASEIADEVQTRTIAAVATVNTLANDSITAASLAASAGAEIRTGLATSAELAALATTAQLQSVRLSAAGVNDILRTALTEAYAENGDEFTLSQALYMIVSMLANRRVEGDVLRNYGLDGTTQVMTFLLDDVIAPTEQIRQS